MGRARPLGYAHRSFFLFWMKVHQKKILLLGVTENSLQSAATISLGYVLFSLLIFTSIAHMKEKIRRYGLCVADLFSLEAHVAQSTWMTNQGFISSVSVIYPSFGFTWALSLRFPTPTPPTPFSLANSYLPSRHSYFPPFPLLITLKKWPYPTQIFPF